MNPQRLFLLAYSKDKAKPPTPEQLAKREQLFGIPLWLSVYGPIMGAPLSCLDNAYTEEYYTLFRGKKYILGLFGSRTMTEHGHGSRGPHQRVAVVLSAECTQADKAEAFYAGCLYDGNVNRGAQCQSSQLLFFSLSNKSNPTSNPRRRSKGGSAPGLSPASPASPSHASWMRSNVLKPTAAMFGEPDNPALGDNVKAKGGALRGEGLWDLGKASLGPDMGWRYTGKKKHE